MQESNLSKKPIAQRIWVGHECVLYQIDTLEDHYFEGELLYPYPGVRFDYFHEESTDQEQNIKKLVSAYVEQLYLNLCIICRNFPETKQIGRKFICYNQRNEPARRYLRQYVVLQHIENYINDLYPLKPGKTAVHSIADLLVKNIVSGAEEVYRIPPEQFDSLFTQLPVPR